MVVCDINKYTDMFGAAEAIAVIWHLRAIMVRSAQEAQGQRDH
jgi:hypothetical protein